MSGERKFFIWIVTAILTCVFLYQCKYKEELSSAGVDAPIIPDGSEVGP